MTSKIQAVGENFSEVKFMEARKKTMEAVTKIAQMVEVGCTEDYGNSLIDAVLNSLGAEKKWHPNKFRIGVNTTKSFRDKSEKDIVLKENDIYFIDIGPVFDNHEGDYGETFVVGQSKGYEAIVKASKIVFQQTADAWKNENKSGIELYQFAEDAAEKLGYKLNQRMKGHRVGDFPHHVFYKGGLNETEEIPCNNLWILEIHLVSSCGTFGAFYEDILKK